MGCLGLICRSVPAENLFFQFLLNVAPVSYYGLICLYAGERAEKLSLATACHFEFSVEVTFQIHD